MAPESDTPSKLPPPRYYYYYYYYYNCYYNHYRHHGRCFAADDDDDDDNDYEATAKRHRMRPTSSHCNVTVSEDYG
jgi:hypothetical protein